MWKAQEQSRADALQTLAESAASLPPELTAETAIAEGEDLDSAFAAIDWSDGDLLVLGSSALGPVARVFLGGMSSRLLRHAPVPVLVVPRGPRSISRRPPSIGWLSGLRHESRRVWCADRRSWQGRRT